MIIPVERNNPVVRKPYAIRVIVILNTCIYLLTLVDFNNIVYNYGFIPSEFSFESLFTSIFIHGGFWHLAGNMYFLYSFGDNVEDILSWKLFMPSYLLLGIAASLTHYYFTNSPDIPCIGASGAISGIMGLYLVFYPKVSFYIALAYRWQSISYKTNALAAIGVWFVLQFVFQFIRYPNTEMDNIAYMAHIGGFTAGYALGWIFKAMSIDKIYFKKYGKERIKLLQEREKKILLQERNDNGLLNNRSEERGDFVNQRFLTLNKNEFVCGFCDKVNILNDTEITESKYNCAFCNNLNTELLKKTKVQKKKPEEREYICTECGTPLILSQKKINAGHYRCPNCSMEINELSKEKIKITEEDLKKENLDPDSLEYYCQYCGIKNELNIDQINAKVFICMYCGNENLELKKTKPLL